MTCQTARRYPRLITVWTSSTPGTDRRSRDTAISIAWSSTFARPGTSRRMSALDSTAPGDRVEGPQHVDGALLDRVQPAVEQRGVPAHLQGPGADGWRAPPGRAPTWPAPRPSPRRTAAAAPPAPPRAGAAPRPRGAPGRRRRRGCRTGRPPPAAARGRRRTAAHAPPPADPATRPRRAGSGSSVPPPGAGRPRRSAARAERRHLHHVGAQARSASHASACTGRVELRHDSPPGRGVGQQIAEQVIGGPGRGRQDVPQAVGAQGVGRAGVGGERAGRRSTRSSGSGSGTACSQARNPPAETATSRRPAGRDPRSWPGARRRVRLRHRPDTLDGDDPGAVPFEEVGEASAGAGG